MRGRRIPELSSRIPQTPLAAAVRKLFSKNKDLASGADFVGVKGLGFSAWGVHICQDRVIPVSPNWWDLHEWKCGSLASLSLRLSIKWNATLPTNLF